LTAARSQHGISVNIRRGFFRLWIVASCLWLAGVAVAFWGQTATPRLPPKVYVLRDSRADFYELTNPSDRYDSEIRSSHSSIEFPNNVTLLVHNTVPTSVAAFRGQSFAEQHAIRAKEVSAARLAVLETAVAVGVTPICVLFVVGSMIAWSLSGFKSERHQAP